MLRSSFSFNDSFKCFCVFVSVLTYSILKGNTNKTQLVQDYTSPAYWSPKAFLSAIAKMLKATPPEWRAERAAPEGQRVRASCWPWLTMHSCWEPCRNSSLEACTGPKGLQVTLTHYFFISYIPAFPEHWQLEKSKKKKPEYLAAF